MYHLPRGATKEQAFSASGLSYFEWKKLIEFAKDESDICVDAHPGTQWRAYSASEQQNITNKINEKLDENGIKPVGEDIIAWKMHILVRDGLAKKKNGKEKANGTGSTTSNRSGADKRASQSSIRPFDPIRDV
ncbi:hypothetical protein BKA63DRAFT_607295 [Paraphoma chrysanthemicola]|nr:hypothetical protein BKA63DRAFT_607295 [Paraphoma chrysanthemicola]